MNKLCKLCTFRGTYVWVFSFSSGVSPIEFSFDMKMLRNISSYFHALSLFTFFTSIFNMLCEGNIKRLVFLQKALSVGRRFLNRSDKNLEHSPFHAISKKMIIRWRLCAILWRGNWVSRGSSWMIIIEINSQKILICF